MSFHLRQSIAALAIVFNACSLIMVIAGFEKRPRSSCVVITLVFGSTAFLWWGGWF